MLYRGKRHCLLLEFLHYVNKPCRQNAGRFTIKADHAYRNHSGLKLNTISGTAVHFVKLQNYVLRTDVQLLTGILSRRILCYFVPFSCSTFLNLAIISALFCISLLCSSISLSSSMNMRHFISPVYGFPCT
jgi:hypothetical protein